MSRLVVGAAVLALVLTGCGGDDGGSGDEDLVRLLQDEADQPEAVAACIADRLADDDQVDRDALDAIIRGEGTTDTDTANAYCDAAEACQAAG